VGNTVGNYAESLSGLLSAPQQENEVEAQLWAAPLGPALQENVIEWQPWPTFASDFNTGAFPDQYGTIAAQQALFGLPFTFQQPPTFQGEENAIERQFRPAVLVPNLNAGDLQLTSLNLLRAQQPPSFPQSFPCAQPGCNKSFRRDSDRTRHQNTIHSARLGHHLCPISGCSKSHGAGYSRADKVTEHLWKKHANLGYTKRV
jgi:hypothetical protein